MTDRSHPTGTEPVLRGATSSAARQPGATAPTAYGLPDRHPFYLLSKVVVAATLRLLADVRVDGFQHCPLNGGVIVASNHLSYVDIPLIGAWCPRMVIYFTKSELATAPVLGGITRMYRPIYVRRGESDRQAVRAALGSLACGQVLGIFPEGHRSRGAGLLPAMPGVALLAQRSGAPVWPVALTGTERVGRTVRPRITLTGGLPFHPVAEAREAYGREPSHQEIADHIMRRIAALLPEGYRGHYK